LLVVRRRGRLQRVRSRPKKPSAWGLVLTTTPDSEMVGPDPIYPPTTFAHALRGLGYIEGWNLVLERRSAEGRFERLGDIVAELVRLRADVIVTGGNPAARAAKAVTATAPIVAAGVADLVADRAR
jgi:ABC transporter substrate binding protein